MFFEEPVARINLLEFPRIIIKKWQNKQINKFTPDSCVVSICSGCNEDNGSTDDHSDRRRIGRSR